MKTKILVSTAFLGLFFISYSALTYTSAPPDSHSNAPGEGNCTSCHSGTSLNGGGAINNLTLTTTTSLSTLLPNTTYDFDLSFSQAGRTKYGFQLCVLPTGAISSSASIGTLIASGSGIQLSSSTSPNRTYLTHDASGTSAPTASKTWQFQYTTPSGPISGPVFYVVVNATNNNSSTSGDFIYAKTFTATVLPVKWGEFSASLNTNKVTINWQTLTEVNNNYFEIERSNNGFDWLTLGKINGSGNKKTLTQYTFIDEEVTSSFYYRIKQIDYNGAFDYSKIIRVETNLQKDVKPQYNLQNKQIVMPNFDYEEINLSGINGNNYAVSRKISNGLLVMDTHHLPAGIYILKANHQGKIAYWKILIN